MWRLCNPPGYHSFILVPFTSSVSVIVDTSISSYNASIEMNECCVRLKARTSICMKVSHAHSQASTLKLTLTLGVNRNLPLHTGQHCPCGVSMYSSTQFNTGHATRLHSTVPPCLNTHRLEKCRQKFYKNYEKFIDKQVCIPIGCVPPAGCPYLPAYTAPGGVYSRGCLLRGKGGVCSQGGVCSRGGIPACTEADTPVNRITDTCKNITLPQLRCER